MTARVSCCAVRLRLQAQVKLSCRAGNASDAEKRTLFQDCRASLHTAAVHLSQEAEAQISLLGIMADMQQVGAARFSSPTICLSGEATALHLVHRCQYTGVLCCWTCKVSNVCMPLNPAAASHDLTLPRTG